ncbi:MAG: hypothetical protein Ct9H300mP28_22320 [Pseudomonadota bacterium]|nr:MAG: hypothetical protein Ct9H300mP28_22320 [Pseudomonadota bacterium]
MELIFSWKNSLNSNLERQKKMGSAFSKNKSIANLLFRQLMFNMGIIFWKLALVMESDSGIVKL